MLSISAWVSASRCVGPPKARTCRLGTLRSARRQTGRPIPRALSRISPAIAGARIAWFVTVHPNLDTVPHTVHDRRSDDRYRGTPSIFSSTGRARTLSNRLPNLNRIRRASKRRRRVHHQSGTLQDPRLRRLVRPTKSLPQCLISCHIEPHHRWKRTRLLQRARSRLEEVSRRRYRHSARAIDKEKRQH
jgi:hypothetical protein